MTDRALGKHDDCDNDKHHLVPNDCWKQPDMYEDDECM